jgi:hypothetical protein
MRAETGNSNTPQGRVTIKPDHHDSGILAQQGRKSLDRIELLVLRRGQSFVLGFPQMVFMQLSLVG